jgi:hypothetical protein
MFSRAAIRSRLISDRILRYPLTKREENDDYLRIEVYKYQPPGLELSGAQNFALRTTEQAINQKKVLLHTIILPIPEDLQDSNSANWGDSSLNPLQSAVVEGISGVMGSKNPFSGLTDQIGSIFSGATSSIQDSETQKALQAGLTELASKSLLGDNINLVTRATGSILNPNTELLFNTVTLRDFGFNFDFVPRNKEESAIVKNIIRVFKYYMAASKGKSIESGGGILIKSPDVFKLTYMSGSNKHPFLNTFKLMALTGISLSYTGSGTYATYSDGTPVNMRLGLTFKELDPVYKEDYESGEATIGVGY